MEEAPKIDARHLAHVLAIAKHGSFAKAATALHMSQPALSNSIAVLERRLGVSILERSRRGSRFNASGEILVRHAEGLTQLLVRTREEVHLASHGVRGPLAVGATASLVPRFMPEVVDRLTARHGPLQLSITEGSEPQLSGELLTGRLELVVGPVTGAFVPPVGVEEEGLVDDPLMLALSPDNPRVLQSPVRLADLMEAPWVLPPRGTLYVEALFQAANLPWPTDCITSSSVPLIEAIVRGGDRVTIMSKLRAMAVSGPTLRTVPLRNAGPRRIGVRRRAGGKLSPLAQEFLDALREVAALPHFASEG